MAEYTVHKCDLHLKDNVLSPCNMKKGFVFESNDLCTAINVAFDKNKTDQTHYVVFQKRLGFYRDWY